MRCGVPGHDQPPLNAPNTAGNAPTTHVIAAAIYACCFGIFPITCNPIARRIVIQITNGSLSNQDTANGTTDAAVFKGQTMVTFVNVCGGDCDIFCDDSTGTCG